MAQLDKAIAIDDGEDLFLRTCYRLEKVRQDASLARNQLEILSQF